MAEGKWKRFRKVVLRKRFFEPEQLETGNLRRCLTRWDLTGLGLGSTLGVGVYVLVGSVALRIAGPSIVLSFLIAAVASLFAGLCYAEFGSRVPKAGSAYIYTYVTVGELVAFIIGWNVVLEGLFGTASVAKGLSTYIDSMSGGAMSAWFQSFAPVSTGYFFSSYFDFFAFFIVLVLGVLLAFGVKESSMVNNALAVINLAVILFIIVTGAVRANASNWSIPESEVPTNTTTNYGTGGFFPYGPWGTLKGAAVCFYGFVGFEVISATGEEVRDPRRSIPVAILTVLMIVFFVYAGVSTVVTMMVPYFYLDRVAAVATAFSYVGMVWARWIVSVGAVFGICASLFGAMFPLPRLLYAMASDGLLLHWFARVSDSNQSPRIATALPACLIAILAGTVELDQLILMMCIGTLLSYTIVAACVIILRYRSVYKLECPSYMRQMFGCGGRTPTRATSRIVDVILVAFICVCVIMAAVVTHTANPLIPVSILHVIALVLLLVITVQPQAKEELSFKTPLVPIIPLLSIYINIHLMILVSMQTWIRVGIWILIGLPIYALCLCCYKRKRNNLEENMKTFSHADMNGKPPVQIIVESPTPPGTTRQTSTFRAELSEVQIIENQAPMQDKLVRNHEPLRGDEIIVQQAVVENNEEKEAKIIDLLDQVLQAEEDTYGEILSLKEDDVVTSASDGIPHRKSLSELSDAGSDASLGSHVFLSKYDVIAQVHREDLPRVSEEEEKHEKDEAAYNDDVEMGDTEHINEETGESEQITAFNDSDTNSRTDESGYSDTIDRNALNDSIEDTREDVPYIPTPPPFDENYFATSYFKKSYSIPPSPVVKGGYVSNDTTEAREDAPYIPPPPPFDESFFSSPYFRKSYSIPRVPVKLKPVEVEEENKPRESVKSSDSHDGTMVFGSDRQMSFMSKLNKIYQSRITPEGEEQRRRSNSTGDMVENSTFALNRERPSLFYELKNELLSLPSTPNLRPVNAEEKQEQAKENEDGDTGMSKEDLRSKLTVIFGTGGPKPFKPRVMKSNPPTPEESYHTDSSTESITKLPKMEKNDTLKRQKDKFSEVLNSFRLSLNRDDTV